MIIGCPNWLDGEKEKEMKKIVSMIMVVVIAMGIMVGCASNSKINVKDIDWVVSQGMEDGRRMVKFKYTNNSKYTITSLNIRMRLKKNVTKDDLASFDYEEWMGDYELEEIFMDAECDEVVKPNETSTQGEFSRNNIFYVFDIAEYENVEPDIMTIVYLNENNAESTLYYDFHSHAYYEE